MIEEKIRQFAECWGMLPEGAKVLCAVSGGADSVCLLHLLHGMEGVSLVCAHYNHGLRGAESDRDERFVRELCDRLGIPCITGRGDVAAFAAQQGLGIEEAARKLRYAFLEQTAAEQGCGRIATAHNAEDNAETVLLNLVRGSGLKGLCGIPPVRGNIVRPLLTVTRAEILRYLEEHGLDHTEDSSNGSDDYARNRIRHHVLPLLREQNSAAIENIGAAAALLRKDEEYLSAQAEHFIEDTYNKNGALSVSAFLALPQPVGARVLRRLCPGAERTHVDAVYMLCMNRAVHGEADLPGMRVVKDYDGLRFDPEESRPISRQVLEPGQTLLTEGWRVRCSAAEGQNGEIHNSFNTFCFKSESICGRIYFTSRENGDSVRLLGRGCTKTLKKLFAEAGLPLDQRIRTPVLRDDCGVIAVYGFGIAERCAPQPGSGVIQIEIQRIPEKEDTDDEKYSG